MVATLSATIDFSELPNGNPLNGGDYLSNEWYDGMTMCTHPGNKKACFDGELKSPSIIALWFELRDKSFRNGSSWSEKIFADLVRNEHPSISNFNIAKRMTKLFLDNMPLKNGKGYPLRVFTIETDAVPSKDDVQAGPSGASLRHH